ncbi:acyl-CoA thioesterase [Rhizobium sp. BR 314]|uniref:acyl-CoA thioesterase n=1 Tax=Rhizobium sp. BR 314 TaxID=3040013 RepID=UPI0039BEE605
MTSDIRIEHFPWRAVDKIRYGDTDRQGHVNNAVFATFLETGRVEVLYNATPRLAEPDCAFVLARLMLDFRAEILWPGEVIIGTRVASVGRSSLTLAQAVFQDGRCMATAETVIVQVDAATRKPRPLSPGAVKWLTPPVETSSN